ncbi:MAG: maleylpyruvate isomerase family mycothiol-dependent enzyme [Actinomycetota bacterium]
MKVSKKDVLDAVAAQRLRTVELARSLAPADWETIALPGWRIREVFGHLIASDEGALKLRLLKIGVRPHRDGAIGALEQWNETQVKRWSEKSIEDLISGLVKWGRRSISAFKPVPELILQRRIPLPFGKVPLLYLGQIRLYDEWVHEQDVRRALQRPDIDKALMLAAARAMLDIAITQTPARIPSDAHGRVTMRIDEIGMPPLHTDLGKGKMKIGVPDSPADSSIIVEASSIMMVAAQRDRWRDAEQSGLLKIEGMRAPAEQFLDAFRAG